MKHFLTKVIIISLPILFGAILMEILLRNTPNDYLFKKQYLDNNSSEIETLILGSSHSFYGFNPKYFSSNTFNASHVSQSLNFDFEILKKYQDKLKNLKTVVLPISYFTLYHKLISSSESWRVKNYVIYYGLNLSKSLVHHSEVLSNQFNVNIKRIVSYYLFTNSPISCTDLGWGTRFNSKNAKDLANTGKTAAKRHTKDINSDKYQEIFNDNILILNSILKWCEKNNINVLLLTPPAFETYRKNLNQEQLEKNLITARNICFKYENCKYYNLLDDTSFVTIDFFDADHLSESGAMKLSVLINGKIND